MKSLLYVQIVIFTTLFQQAMPLKTILTPILICCTVLCHAQVQVSLFAGPQATSARYLINTHKQSTSSKIGMMGGVGLKVPFENNLFFAPAVYYSVKGYKVTFQDTASPPSIKALNNDVQLHTVEFAPLLQLDFNKTASHLFVRFGPTVDLALSGREQFDTLSKGGTVSRNMKFAFTEYGLITASANVHLGWQNSHGLMIFAHYAYGIGSLNNNDGGPKIFHRIGGLSIGWLLCQRRKGI
jgi:hypothetical protein